MLGRGTLPLRGRALVGRHYGIERPFNYYVHGARVTL